MLNAVSPTTLARRAPILGVSGLLCLIAVFPTAYLSLTDDRLFQGLSVWTKPLKFQLSVGIYLLTLAFFVGQLTGAAKRSAVVIGISIAAAVTGLFEVVYITARAGMGLKSHFATDSASSFVLYQIMGVAALILTLSSGALALVFRRHAAMWDGPYRLAVVLGLTITAIAGAATGGAISFNGSHWIGGAATDAGGSPSSAGSGTAVICGCPISSPCTPCTPSRFTARCWPIWACAVGGVS